MPLEWQSKDMENKNRICPQCKNMLDLSAFGWDLDKKVCNGCHAFNQADILKNNKPGECCKDCKRMNTAHRMAAGEPFRICVDEECKCHTKPEKICDGCPHTEKETKEQIEQRMQELKRIADEGKVQENSTTACCWEARKTGIDCNHTKPPLVEEEDEVIKILKGEGGIKK